VIRSLEKEGGGRRGEGLLVPCSAPADDPTGSPPRPRPTGTASLAAVATWVPERAVRVEELGEHLELGPLQLKVLTRVHGLREVRVGPERTVVDALRRVGAAAVAAAGDPSRVSYVLHAHTLQDVAPSTINVVREVCTALGLRRALSCSVTQQNCASGLLALDLAAKLLADDGDDDAVALVLMGEKPFTPLAQLIPSTTIMGEAAAACLVSPRGERDRILAYASRTLGQYSSGLDLDADSLRSFELEYVETLAGLIQEAVARAGLTLDELALVLPHNVNRSSWVRLAKWLELPLDRLFLANVPRLGHCYCADPFLNYAAARGQGRLRPGDHYLMAAVGLGATFSAVVLSH
jgi:3-oxoacyl-[acyl-carrier-protein] synthase-3